MPGQGRLQRGPQLPYKLLAGVVPVPKGWLVAAGKLVGVQVYPEEPIVMATFRDLLDNVPEFAVIAVTVPIGLPTSARRGGRAADREARQLLGFPNAGSIGSTPTRRALQSKDYNRARRLNGGVLDVVTWQQFRKIREVDQEMQPYMQRRVSEVRPELSFFQLAEDDRMHHSKYTAAGRRERQELLRRRMPGSERILDVDLPRVRPTHLTDAAAALWTARRIIARAMTRVPLEPEWDDNGLRMEIVR